MLSLVGSQLRSNSEISISDYQIISLVIAFCDYSVDPTVLTDRLFNEFGTLAAIIAGSTARLGAIEGMTDRLIAFLKFLNVFKMRALQSGIPERVHLTGCADLRIYLTARLQNTAVEELHALFIDNNCHLLSSETLWRGTTNHVTAYPVEIIKRAVELGAVKIILAHNHPSRRTAPSHDDIDLTRKVEATGKPLGISVEDHVIVAGENYISLRELGLLGGETFTEI